LGYAYYLAGENDAALREYQSVLTTDSSFLPVHYYLWQYYDSLGMYDQGLKELSEDFTLTGHAQAADELKQLAGAENRHKLFEALAKSRGALDASNMGSSIGSSEWYMALNEKKATLDALEQSYKAREPGLIYIAVDPIYARLRSDPEFLEIERRIGLQ
jgi:tetratricopeptide (TPR) repeat protein